MATYTDDMWGKLTSGTKKLGNSLGIIDSDADAAAIQAQKDILAEIENLTPVELQELELENPRWLEDLVYQGQGDTNLNNISIDPRLADTQMDSLAALQDVVDSGGMNAQDEANLSRIQSQSATADRGRRDAIKQSMAQRGMGGSGMELLQQLQSNQAATDRQAQGGLDVAGMAQDRALSAMMQGGQLAGNIRGQEFDEQKAVFSAQDAIDKFNTGNQFGADRYNIGGRQNIADQSVQNRNTANTYNTQTLPQQNWQNQVDYTNMKTGGMQGVSDTSQAISQQNTDNARAIYTGLARGGAAAYSGGATEAGGAGAALTGSTQTAPTGQPGQKKNPYDQYGSYA